MSYKHTPGPWAIRFDMISGDHDREVVAYTTDSEGNPCGGAAQLANARLIAASPDLLAALADLTECFWEGRPKRNVKRDYSLMVRHAEAVRALAKARGEG